ncbi:ABC transporter substrate-binding protein [Paenibacillus hunanensis]|uniref:ABC-type glycerol-3-phosphate transport system substrate-binding protein n=1 Tax=Paenibacillus hunanensis TaxID=539262 RepID=A0ABU1IVJ3_9BACL|nr:extracellular solute-binding protein [Paenibacillus hunanensis]MDR6242941.1 ABC-type glycerol-3-phosphate transport system substrate-binding protein [Paenibacillus hunanensis]GGJ13312.1 sugar ABC transporter substrate-binding protein [Paenibacillus hunanensis]
MKKVIIVLASMLVTSVILSACGSGSTSNTASNGAGATGDGAISGTVTFLTNRTDMIGTQFDDYAKRFHEKYPNAQVEFEAITDLDKTTKIRMSSGDYPDVVLIPTIPNSDLPKYFTPLDDLGLNDNIYFKDYKSYEGKVYGISVGATTTGIVYNKKAFADAGITEIPKTLDEFYAASEKLKAKGIVPLASNFKDQWPLYPWISEVPTSMAGDAKLNNDRMNSDTPYQMNNPYGKSMTIIRTMYEKGYLEKDVNSTNWEQSKKDVASGKFAMVMLGNWVIPQIIASGTTSDNIGFFPLPYDNSGKVNVSLAPDWAYGVNKNSENVATAKAFVKWMIEDSGFDQYAGFIPVLKDKKATIPQLQQFDSFKPVTIEAVADDPKVTDIVNHAQITKEALVQEFILAHNPQSVLDKYNAAWAKARKDILK